MRPSPASEIVTDTKEKSLKKTLRGILAKCRRQTPDVALDVVGSGILRRERSLPGLDHHSTTSFWTEPEPPQTSIPSQLAPTSFKYPDEDDLDVIPNHFDIASLATSISFTQFTSSCIDVSLQRKASFRHVQPHLHQPAFSNKASLLAPPTQSIVPHRPQYAEVSGVYAGIGSQHASVVTLPHVRPSASTLRIQSSTSSLRSQPSSISSACVSSQPRGLSRKTSSVSSASVRQGGLPAAALLKDEPTPSNDHAPRPGCDDKHHDRSTYSAARFARPPSPLSTVSECSDEDNSTGLLSVNHFASFCALDTGTPGCPVTATSKDLRYIFDLGEQFCLNNRGIDGASIDMITGTDAGGNPITHLVLFSPLIAPNSGRSRFMLASLVDVTDFINDSTALIPELETISEESSLEDEVRTPTYKPRPPLATSADSPKAPPMSGPRIALSAEDLLGGCFVAEPPTTPVRQQYVDDIWLNLATEERSKASTRASSSHRSSVYSIDDILDDFMTQLQDLYSDFFLLAKSPLDDQYYEISNVSPRVYAGKDYMHGHLTKTPAHVMTELSSRLAYDDPFSLFVRWGSAGALKQLYCIPLFARTSITWICFLVDPGLPTLW